MTAHSSRSNSTGSLPPTTSFWLQARRPMAGWQIRAEVVIIAISICDTARYSKMRQVYPLPLNVANDTKEADKFFNKHMIEWDQNYAYVNVPLACLMTIILGAYSDRNGRKLSMLVGLCGMLLGNAVYILVWWKRTNLRLEFVFFAAVLDGLCGGFRLVISAVNAFLSDQFEAKRTLSIRMIVTYTLLNVGDLLGSQLTNAAILLGSNEVVVMLVVEGILVFTIVYVLLVIHDFMSLERSEAENRRNALLACWHVVGDAFRSLACSFRVLARKRPDSRRLLLLLILLCAFINRLAFSEEKSLIGTYTKLPPFEWTTRDYATYKTVRPFLQIIGLLFGLFVLKGWLRLRDSLILLIATFSMGLDALLIGLAWNSLLIYASLTVGFMHALVNPLSYTLLSCVAESKEMGRVYAVDTVVDNLAFFLRTAILQSVYTATNFIWFVLASMGVFSASIFAVVHVISRRRNVFGE
ncbi:Major facilitator superfamily MFS-1 domain containing protein [Aphelenchoides fujianensis]|nr:Major facilitator superfamily MFS-1 domain containing protein [Aphelenchoides fujianensis]